MKNILKKILKNQWSKQANNPLRKKGAFNNNTTKDNPYIDYADISKRLSKPA